MVNDAGSVSPKSLNVVRHGKRPRIAIVGAGIAGRLIAWMLAAPGDEAPGVLTVYDARPRGAVDTCSATAAGMIAPWTELANRDPLIADIGLRSLALWPAIVRALADEAGGTPAVFFQQSGSLMVAASRDRPEIDHFVDTLRALGRERAMQPVAGAELRELEPDLAPGLTSGLFFPDEAQVDSRGLLDALARALDGRVTWRWARRVTAIRATANDSGSSTARQAEAGVAVESAEVGGGCTGTAQVPDAPAASDAEPPTPDREMFDLVIDCRGLDARDALPELRGVRGELVEVFCPEVRLRRPVRFLHPRTNAYLVPRPGDRYLIGASVIESDDLGPISVRSVLELLTAAWTVNPAFAEARVLSTRVNCRPALDDNQPRIMVEAGGRVLRVNGLFRHGYLLAPAIAEQVVTMLFRGTFGGGADRPGVPALPDIAPMDAAARRALDAIIRPGGRVGADATEAAVHGANSVEGPAG